MPFPTYLDLLNIWGESNIPTYHFLNLFGLNSCMLLNNP
uniref:Uncharacterized protein n=1 Tax=Anguilla anguilla TaxID=7936 RepID=A0A0E9P7H9_ANGAN